MFAIPHKENCIGFVHTSNDDNDIYYVRPRHNTLGMELLTQQQRAVAVADPPPRPIYRGAYKSLARSGRKQATATEDFEFHISYL